jgi:hypothetical protein
VIRLHTPSTVWAEVHRFVLIHPNRHRANLAHAGIGRQMTHWRIGLALRAGVGIHDGRLGNIIDTNSGGPHLSQPPIDHEVNINTLAAERSCYISRNKDKGCHTG